MNLKLHANATTTPKTRAYIQASTVSVAEMAAELGVHETTIRRWRQRTDTADRSTQPHRLHTSLAASKEGRRLRLRSRMMNRLCALCASLATVCFSFVGSHAVLAHDWYSSTADPVYQSNCCGGHDCAPVDSEWVSEVAEGYRLKMTIDQARTVNPAAETPVDAVVPWSRIQSPPTATHAFYACIYDRDRAAPRYGVICFFATPTM
ncbi:MAG: helix-turn-helix domain-containing protein [Alphaproteobacteria bacterium]|nr:MAG: helix-turn-helix domain-containing protein [Alphaproteobacteria bacterium]